MENNLQKALGRRIKELRNGAGLSQEQFSEKIGIAINTLSNIERGNSFMTSQTMEKIMTIFKISPQELFLLPEYGKEEDVYLYVMERIKQMKDNKHKLETLKRFIKFVL